MNQEILNVLKKTKLITLATVCEDGSPWVTPLLCHFENGTFMWRSGENAVHSQNIARDPRVAISMWYEDTEISEFEAVYVSTEAVMVGNEAYSEEYDKTTVEYRAPLGALDERATKPHRYYFKLSELAS